MRPSFALALAAVLFAACQPAPATGPADPAAASADAAADAAAEATGDDGAGFMPTWLTTETSEQVMLTAQEFPNAPAFVLTCDKAGPTLTFNAGVDQVALGNMAAPYALVMSGATFPATLTPVKDGDLTFSVSAPLTPDALAAVRDAVTVRISVNDGYAFAESGVDPGDRFEGFAAACARLTGLAAPL
jgi:hypothetical protein